MDNNADKPHQFLIDTPINLATPLLPPPPPAPPPAGRSHAIATSQHFLISCRGQVKKTGGKTLKSSASGFLPPNSAMPPSPGICVRHGRESAALGPVDIGINRTRKFRASNNKINQIDSPNEPTAPPADPSPARVPRLHRIDGVLIGGGG